MILISSFQKAACHRENMELVGFTAFLTFGFLGSLHCLGMCAPLSILLGLNPGQKMGLRLALYHGGRIISYASLGFIFNLLGHRIEHQIKTPVLAWMVVIPLIIYALHIPFPKPLFLSKLSTAVMKPILCVPLKIRSLIVGLATPLLPCGFLYGAVMGSAGASHPLMAALWMAAFACGTIPTLWIGQSGALWITDRIGSKGVAIIFRIIALGGALFILWMTYFSGHCASCHEH